MSEKLQKNDVSLDMQHHNWMNVTGTAVNPMHRVDGYKGQIKGDLIRPKASCRRRGQ